MFQVFFPFFLSSVDPRDGPVGPRGDRGADPAPRDCARAAQALADPGGVRRREEGRRGPRAGAAEGAGRRQAHRSQQVKKEGRFQPGYMILYLIS